jgi:23S rRNA (adenine2030-N6)-methyltransferase
MDQKSERYSHRFHAGNVGDVWKHVVWMALLDELTRQDGPLHVHESHSGEGLYKLPPSGEWQAGLGRAARALEALQAADDHVPAALEAFFAALARFPRGTYPGSPLWTLTGLRASDRATFYEIDAEAHARLEKRVGRDARAKACLGDGLGALEKLGRTRRRRVVFIDPPYSAKEDWITVPTAVADCHGRDPSACIVLWYPIKSYTRPNAMLELLQVRGVPALTLELVTTPLKLQRNRLNGSGMLLVNAPGAAVSKAMATAATLGAACATHDNHWAVRAHRVEA